MNRAAALGFFASLALGDATAGEPLSSQRQREILQAAVQSFDEAAAAAPADKPHAQELYRQAAAGFLALHESGLVNAGLEYNLGNTYFRLGDLGRAILHYRRAERLAPRDGRLRANLEYARGQVEPRIPPSGERRLARQLLFWHYDFSSGARFGTMVLISLVAWPLLFGWLRWRRRGLLISGVVGAALIFALSGSVLWQMHDEAARPAAVTIAAHTPLRLARGDTADLAFKEPLGAGSEVRILQQRGDWVEVRLANDQTGWLPESAVERV